MDDGTRLFLWMIAGAGYFGVLGGLFGAVTGALAWKSGRPAGTKIGLGVAQAFRRLDRLDTTPQNPSALEDNLEDRADQDQCDHQRKTTAAVGALVGGVDGFVFLGLIGLGVGFLAGRAHPAEWGTLWPVLVLGTVLSAGALSFGLLAYALVQGRLAGVVWLFVGSMAGAFVGRNLGGLNGLLLGMLTGAFFGAIVMAIWQSIRPPESGS